MHPLVDSMLKGDKRALARLMTFVDNRHENLLEIMREVYSKTKQAKRIGVTGPPGAGKSSLVDKLIKQYRNQNKKVGVICIDPSSPFTGGAVLGDRIRMMDHGADENVFIRSLGSRGSHGGLSRATRDIVELMDAFGFEIIIIETVGVGQTELDIMGVADTTLVVLVPESGDTIQTMKAGLMEIADIFAVNKADREGADRIFAELKALAEMYGSQKEIPVLKTVAIKNQGINELTKALDDKLSNLKKSNETEISQILTQASLDIFISEIHQKLLNQIKPEGKFSDVIDKLTHHKNPYLAASQLLEKIKWK